MCCFSSSSARNSGESKSYPGRIRKNGRKNMLIPLQSRWQGVARGATAGRTRERATTAAASTPGCQSCSLESGFCWFLGQRSLLTSRGRVPASLTGLHRQGRLTWAAIHRQK